MKTTKRKASGFFIVEILIVLAIIAILVTALLPNLSNYTKRARFADVLSAVEASKANVELCALNANGAFTTCDFTSVGAQGANVASVAGVDGVITGTGTTAVFGSGITYILTPSYDSATTAIIWSDTASTCKTASLC